MTTIRTLPHAFFMIFLVLLLVGTAIQDVEAVAVSDDGAVYPGGGKYRYEGGTPSPGDCYPDAGYPHQARKSHNVDGNNLNGWINAKSDINCALELPEGHYLFQWNTLLKQVWFNEDSNYWGVDGYSKYFKIQLCSAKSNDRHRYQYEERNGRTTVTTTRCNSKSSAQTDMHRVLTRECEPGSVAHYKTRNWFVVFNPKAGDYWYSRVDAWTGQDDDNPYKTGGVECGISGSSSSESVPPPEDIVRSDLAYDPDLWVSSDLGPVTGRLSWELRLFDELPGVLQEEMRDSGLSPDQWTGPDPNSMDH